jgi:cell division protein FtsB
VADFPDYVTVPELQAEILELRARVTELEAELTDLKKPRPAPRRAANTDK